MRRSTRQEQHLAPPSPRTTCTTCVLSQRVSVHPRGRPACPSVLSLADMTNRQDCYHTVYPGLSLLRIPLVVRRWFERLHADPVDGMDMDGFKLILHAQPLLLDCFSLQTLSHYARRYSRPLLSTPYTRPLLSTPCHTPRRGSTSTMTMTLSCHVVVCVGCMAHADADADSCTVSSVP